MTYPKEITFIREREIDLDPEELYENEVVIVVDNEADWRYTNYYLGSRGYIVKPDPLR